jgi:transposase
MVVLASAGGNTVPAIARLVSADEDTIRQVIHRFNEMGMASLDPRWAGGRPRQISPDDEQYIVTTANTRPEALGRPFTRWSVRKLADYLCAQASRPVEIGRERLRQLLIEHGITLPADEDVEGVERSAARRETRPHRARDQPLSAASVRVRRIRTAGHPSTGRLRLGTHESSTAAARELPQAARRPAVPRLLQRR